MDQEKLKKEIKTRYANELKSLNVEKIGRLGDSVIWALKRGATVATIYVTVAMIPKATEEYKIHFPKTYELASQKIEYASNFFKSNKPEPTISRSQDEFYIAIDPRWLNKGHQNGPTLERKRFPNNNDITIPSTNYIMNSDKKYALVASTDAPPLKDAYVKTTWPVLWDETDEA